MQNKIREIVWLIAATVCVFTGLHQSWYGGFGQSYMFFIFAIFALGFWYVRRKKRLEAKNE